MTFDRAAFGRAVAARRRALKYPQTGVPNGPSSSYMSDIENAKMDPISAETLDKLAAGLWWDRDLLDAVVEGSAALDALPIGSLQNPGPESYPDRILREATDAQEAFEKAVDNLVAAEATADRANQSAFRIILIQERMREYGETAREADRAVTATDVARAMSDHATIVVHEWTRYEVALIERFDPEYVAHSEDLMTYSRFMDMTAVRRRASRIPLPAIVDEGVDLSDEHADQSGEGRED